MSFSKLLTTKTGSILTSIILGLGLAALFRRACKNGNCVVIKGPNIEEVKRFYYKVNEECYKYNPVIQECK